MKLTFGILIRGLKNCLLKYLFVRLFFLPLMNILTKCSVYEARTTLFKILLLNLLA